MVKEEGGKRGKKKREEEKNVILKYGKYSDAGEYDEKLGRNKNRGVRFQKIWNIWVHV